MRLEASLTPAVLTLLLVFGVGDPSRKSAKETDELLRSTSALEEVTFLRRKREYTTTPDIPILHCYYCEHTREKRNPACADPIDQTYLVLVQCNGTCSKVTWKTLDGILQYNRTCWINTPCLNERTDKLVRYCCRFEECNGTDASRKSLTAILATVALQVVSASRWFYFRFS